MISIQKLAPDLTDARTSVAKVAPRPRIPPEGRHRTDTGEVLNGLMYLLSTGCQWRAVPKDLPPRSTVNL